MYQSGSVSDDWINMYDNIKAIIMVSLLVSISITIHYYI